MVAAVSQTIVPVFTLSGENKERQFSFVSFFISKLFRLEEGSISSLGEETALSSIMIIIQILSGEYDNTQVSSVSYCHDELAYT